MKKNSKLMMALAIVATFIVGFLAGLFIEYPKVNQDEISGTIGKVSNYRNTKATEADIELQNDLKTDKKMQKSVSNYMTFYYTKSLEFGKTIVYAVEQAKSEKTFAAQYATQIESVEKYAEFLAASRKDLLMATLVCQSIEESTPEMLRNSIAQANNIIAQMNYRNSTVISFIESLDAYIMKTGRAANENLNRAHDLLVYNQIGASVVSKDKVLMKYFDKKQLFSRETKTTPVDIKGSMIKDLEALNTIYFVDMEKLGVTDKEKLGLKSDAEELGRIMINDNEKLQYVVSDMEKLGNIIACDAEKLGFYNDIEKLGNQPLLFDAEKLGIWDAEKLGTRFTDDEKLAGFWDAEMLGGIELVDVEKLSTRLMDSEKLGAIVVD